MSSTPCRWACHWCSYLGKNQTFHVPSCQQAPLAVQDEAPLQLYMHGVDLYMNSHFDVWIVDISQWRPGPIDEENWRVPDFCHQGEIEELQRHKLDSSLAMEVAKQLPNLHFGELETSLQCNRNVILLSPQL